MIPDGHTIAYRQSCDTAAPIHCRRNDRLYLVYHEKGQKNRVQMQILLLFLERE